MGPVRTALVALAMMGMSSTPQHDFHTHSFAPFPETTIDGTVDRVEHAGSDACEACQACAECTGTHLVVRKGTARIEVHLAPAWFLERSGFVFSPGEAVSITGTRITVSRHHGILAREVRRDDVVMKFRDEHGLPLWRRELTER